MQTFLGLLYLIAVKVAIFKRFQIVVDFFVKHFLTSTSYKPFLGFSELQQKLGPIGLVISRFYWQAKIYTVVIVCCIYQYNEDNFRFKFLFLPSFETSWIHMEPWNC